MTPKILCDINDKISFNIYGQSQSVDNNDLADPNNIKRIYRIQFSKAPSQLFLSTVVNIIKSNPTIPLRFYGDYSEDKIEWDALQPIKKLQIDLWQTEKLQAISKLTGLTQLGISKNVKSSVSLKVLEPLDKLESLFVSITKDIQSISTLKNLRFLSLSEIKTKDLDFLSSLEQLEELWLSLGSYDNFEAITKLPSLKRLSIHQVRGFDDETANSILSKCKSLQYLQLQNLKDITSLNFMASLKELKYLNLDGIKNLASYSPIAFNQSIETISLSNSRPADKDLKPLLHLQNVWSGDSYDKSAVAQFTTQFRGLSFRNRGKDIVGSMQQNYSDPFNLAAWE